LSVNVDQVVISPGAKPNLFFPTLALVEPGDEVLYPDPGFPSYAAMIGVAGGVPVPVPLVEGANFSFDLDSFDTLISSRTRLIILNSPGNPTGGVMPHSDLEHIANLALKHDCWVISDEIYSRIHYLDDEVPMLATHAYGCTAHFTQYAGLEALRGSQAEVDAMLTRYRQRRDRLVSGLNTLPGVRCELPQGAFYAFPNIKETGISSKELADKILNEAGVALLPGTPE
jgi:aspartate/methionine/tyrosine aminotransferase